MAQETVTEFKTEEYQITKTLCDNCGRTEEEAQILPVSINPIEEASAREEVEIQTFQNAEEARSYIHDNTGKEEIFDPFTNVVKSEKKYRTLGLLSSAEADVCTSCVFKLFGIEIPEDEEVEEIEIEEGELHINTTKEVRSIWPQVNIPEWDNSFGNNPELGWKGKVLFWPIPFLISMLELSSIDSPQTGNVERQKGFTAGSFGAILWTAIILGIMWFTSMLVFAF